MRYRDLVETINIRHRYFILGGNPDRSGGGVIASRNTLEAAEGFARLALMEGYSHVRIRGWSEMMEGEI